MEDNETSTVDNGAMKQLRDANKALSKSLKEAETLASSAYDQARRDIALEGHLTQFGMPQSLKAMVASELGDNEVNAGSVQEALEALEFTVNQAPAADDDDDGDSRMVPSPVSTLADTLAGVTDLGSQVANAASNHPHSNLTDKINEAQTPEEVATLMRSAGLSS